LQAVKAQLESRGFGMNADEAQAVQLVGGEQLVIPFGQDAHLVWTRTNGQTAAVGLVRQGNKTLNVGADGQERVVRVLSGQKAEKLLRKLREKGKFQDFEGKLAQKGKRVGKVRVMLDETNKLAIVGIAAEGSEKIAHQVRIKVKAGKDDEPEDDAEPAIQATACGQASGEAVPLGARMQPLMLDAGEGGDVTTGSYTLIEGDYGPQICTSQWGYDYLCLSRTPSVSLSTTSLALPQTFINQQVQASFVIWNGGGGTLTGTVSAPAPFSIVSGASFSLLPGQPQEVVVRFSSATAGSFSKSIAISSNGGNATVTATGVAHKVSFSPAPLDFGSGLLVMREQCNNMGACGLRTEKVGLPIEKALTVKNEGTVAVSLTLSTTAPYKIVSVLPTLSPGQSAQVTLRFDPTESGSFTGTVQVGINGGQGSVTSSPMTGVAHKIEIDPVELDFGIVFVGSTKERKLTVKNQGVTTVTLEVPNTTQNTASPFRVMLESPLVLTPGESKKVLVQLSPTTSGEFTGTVRLMSGQAVLEIPAKAKAYTEEEYRQMLKQSILATCQATGESFPIPHVLQASALNTYFVRGLNDEDFLFYQMPCPTDEELDAWFNLLLALQQAQPDLDYFGPGPFDDPGSLMAGLEALMYKINYEVSNIDRNRDGFISQEELASVRDAILGYLEFQLINNPNYKGLATFINALIGPESNYISVIRTAIGIGLSLLARAGYISPNIPFGYAIGSLLLALANVQQWPNTTLNDNEIEARKFVVSLAIIMAGINNGHAAVSAVINSNKSIDSRMSALVTITFAGMAALSAEKGREQTDETRAIFNAGLTLEFFAEFLKAVAIAYSSPIVESTKLSAYMKLLVSFIGPSGIWENYANNLGGFIVFTALSQDQQYHWTIHGGAGWYGFYYQADVQLVATTEIQGRQVTVFIHVEAKLGKEEVSRVVDKVRGIIGIAQGWTRGGDSDVGTKVIVLIIFDAEPGAVDALEQNLKALRSPLPIVILVRNKNGNWDPRIIGDPNDQTFLQAVAAALKQALEQLSLPYEGQDAFSLAMMLISQAPILAQLAYPGLSPKLAWWLAYGICGGELGCILMIEESIKAWLNENAAANCQWRYDVDMEPASRFKFKKLMPC